MGTLGKALGTFGAFVAGSEVYIETLLQHARTYIYTTALPPAVAAATRASLRLVRSEHWRRDARENEAYVRRFEPSPDLVRDLEVTPTDRLGIWKVHALAPRR